MFLQMISTRLFFLQPEFSLTYRYRRVTSFVRIGSNIPWAPYGPGLFSFMYAPWSQPRATRGIHCSRRNTHFKIIGKNSDPKICSMHLDGRIKTMLLDIDYWTGYSIMIKSPIHNKSTTFLWYGQSLLKIYQPSPSCIV